MIAYVLVAIAFTTQVGGAVVPSITHVADFDDAYTCARSASSLVSQLAANGGPAPSDPWEFLQAGPPGHPLSTFGAQAGNTIITLRCMPTSIPNVEAP